MTALTALAMLAVSALPGDSRAQSWEDSRYPGEVVAAMMIGNRAVIDIAPHRETVLSAHDDGTIEWSGPNGAAADGTWVISADGLFCADWEVGAPRVLSLAPPGRAWCFYLRRTENAVLLYDPFGNVRGGLIRIDIGGGG
ncbi:MAG: hypothetical protein RLO50_20185 [Azospirillaceae bacterium]